MRNSILAALMAATALVPAIASAQDRPERGGEARPQPQHQQPGRGAPSPQQARAPQAPQAVARPQQAPAPAQQRPQFNGGGRPGFGQQGGQPGAGRGAPPQGQPQPQGQFRRGGDDRGAPGRQGLQGQAGEGQQLRGQPSQDRQFQGQNRGGGDFRGNGQSDRPNTANRGGSRGEWNGGRGGAQSWNRGWRGRNQYNWQSYRNSNRQAFHLPRYYAPYGYDYGYRSFGIGAYLNEALFDQGYWIGDPSYYRLPPAYGPYRWVRYYNDALLVNIYTGEVVDEIPGIFW